MHAGSEVSCRGEVRDEGPATEVAVAVAPPPSTPAPAPVRALGAGTGEGLAVFTCRAVRFGLRNACSGYRQVRGVMAKDERYVVIRCLFVQQPEAVDPII